MNRLDAFQFLAQDTWYGRLYEKLSARDRVDCREFIAANDHLDADNFELAVNRWFIDKPKPKSWTAMAELVSTAGAKSKRSQQ